MKIIFLPVLTFLLLIACGCSPETQATGHGTTGTSGATSTTGSTAVATDSLRRTYHLKDLQRVTLTANGHDIPAWVMDDRPKEAEGMMWLVDSDVKDDDGMIFAFPQALPRSFWMENTLLPLDIIYISDKKKVVNVSNGIPNDRTALPSKGAAMYVLEMKQGSASRLKIEPGTTITIPDTVISKIPKSEDQ